MPNIHSCRFLQVPETVCAELRKHRAVAKGEEQLQGFSTLRSGLGELLGHHPVKSIIISMSLKKSIWGRWEVNLLWDIAPDSSRIGRWVGTLLHERAVTPEAVTNIHQEAIEMVDMRLGVSTVFERGLAVNFTPSISDIKA